MDDPLIQARIDLAAAFRLAARFDLNEGICNHFSYAAPERPGCFLVNPFGIHWSQMTASDLLLVDNGGGVLEGSGELETTAFCIHSRIHLRHPRAACVLHTHMPYATTLTALEDTPLEPISQNALRYYNDVAYDPSYNGIAGDVEEGDRMAEAMGEKRVLFLANHGIIVVGDSVAKAFEDLYYLERACQLQVMALSTGRPLKRVTDNVAATTFTKPDVSLHYAQAHFAALKRLLDAEDASYVQ
ncbi:aldolase [Pelagibius litoralis]|uniref:Aldolase n=1 Tax=Pelagibius litoralis TaxID=374515 RepID=A0A967C1U7_9PROT|nr:aldolase [Pelagibius litoralis]NIA67103.1 aldolase [Pelagibius litoralis]